MLHQFLRITDDVEIIGSTCELKKPDITFKGTNYQGTIYSNGPFEIEAEILDTSGIAIAELVYTINNGLPDTLKMRRNTSGSYDVKIPAVTYGDTIDYTVIGIDSSTGACVSSGCKSLAMNSQDIDLTWSL